MSSDSFDDYFPTKPNKRRLNWESAGENALLDMWNQKVEYLRDNKRPSSIYREMATKLRAMGYSLGWRNVQSKIRNFTQRFRKERKAAEFGIPSAWPYYDKVSEILDRYYSNKSNDKNGTITNESSLPPTFISVSSNQSSSKRFNPERASSVSSSDDSLLTPMASSSAKRRKLTETQCETEAQRSSNFEGTILKKFDDMAQRIDKYFNKTDGDNGNSNGNDILNVAKLQTEILKQMVKTNIDSKNALLKAEKEKTETLKQMAIDNLEMKRAMLEVAKEQGEVLKQIANDHTELKVAIVKFLNK